VLTPSASRILFADIVDCTAGAKDVAAQIRFRSPYRCAVLLSRPESHPELAMRHALPGNASLRIFLALVESRNGSLANPVPKTGWIHEVATPLF
jgi:hypothetical protein